MVRGFGGSPAAFGGTASTMTAPVPGIGAVIVVKRGCQPR